MINPVIIFGAKGIGKAALEAFLSNGVEVYAFLDEDETLHGELIGEVSILGAPDDDGYLKLIGKKCDAFVAIDNPKDREKWVSLLNERRKVMPTNAIHRDTSIPMDFNLGHGNFINAGVTIGVGTSLGNHCIIHSGSTIDYDVQIADEVQIGAGCTVGAGVHIAEGAVIGTGSIIMPGMKIGKNAQVGPGSLVIGAVKDKEVVFGSPAKTVER
jgi:sugar O-acyltransferase (sialic acid O-acetyltransferase NeuD family)